MAELMLDHACVDMEEFARRENVWFAWRMWAAFQCDERGGHLWMLDADDGSVSLDCDVCHADAEFLGGCDADLLIYGDVAGVSVDGGVYDDAAGDFRVRVSVDVEVHKYFNPGEMLYPEYDLSIAVADFDSQHESCSVGSRVTGSYGGPTTAASTSRHPAVDCSGNSHRGTSA